MSVSRSQGAFLSYRKLRRQTHVFTSSLCELAESAKRSFYQNVRIVSVKL